MFPPRRLDFHQSAEKSDFRIRSIKRTRLDGFFLFHHVFPALTQSSTISRYHAVSSYNACFYSRSTMLNHRSLRLKRSTEDNASVSASVEELLFYREKSQTQFLLRTFSFKSSTSTLWDKRFKLLILDSHRHTGFTEGSTDRVVSGLILIINNQGERYSQQIQIYSKKKNLSVKI